MTDTKFYEFFGGFKTYNEETKSFELEFDENSPKANPIKSLEFKKLWKVPITSVTYQNITYRVEGKTRLMIEGKENCAKQISYHYMNILSAFPYVFEEVVYVQPPNPNAKPIPTRIAVPIKKIDQINELTIKGYIEDLTLCIDDQNSRFTSPFKENYFPRPQGEDPCPFKFTHLEKVDLSGCISLKKLDWMFIYNGKIRNVILPDYDFTATGNDWISQYNEDLILEEDEPLRIKKINNEHAIYNSPIETGGCCNIA